MEIPLGHEDLNVIVGIARDAILTAFGDTPLTMDEWNATTRVLHGIGHHDARATQEPFIISLARFEYERQFDLNDLASVRAYVARFDRDHRTATARHACLFPLAVVSIAWQVARFGATNVMLTSDALRARYARVASA